MAEEITFIKHAENMLIKRNLSKETVINTLKSPSKTYLGTRTSHLIAIKEENDTTLVVVYDLINKRVEIITAFRTSKITRLIRSKVNKGYWVKIK